MQTYVYSNFKEQLLNGNIDLLNDTIKAALLSSSYSIDTVNDVVWGDVSSNQMTPNGTYVDGGAALSNVAVSEDTTDEEGMFDADDAVLGIFTGSYQYIVLYVDEATKYLIACVDKESVQSVVNSQVIIAWHADGILRVL